MTVTINLVISTSGMGRVRSESPPNRHRVSGVTILASREDPVLLHSSPTTVSVVSRSPHSSELLKKVYSQKV